MEVESMVDNSTNDGAVYTTAFDELEFYRAHPVHINTASFQELSEVPFLSPSLALRILFRRDSAGALSPSDLAEVPEMDKQTLLLVSPFITFDVRENKAESPADEHREWKISFRSLGSSRLRPTTTKIDGEYPGSKIREDHRLELSTANLSGGILYDRDPGETFDAGFVSSYVGLENAGFVRRVVVGDYALNAGEGLTLSSFRSSSRGGDVLSQVKSSGRTIVPHLSTDEFHYFQGAATTIDVYPFSLTTFYSSKAIDAALDSHNVVTSFYSSGLFRSKAELKKRNTAKETVFGGIGIMSVGSTHRIGVTAVSTQYDREVAVQSPTAFRGKTFSAVGFNADFVFDDVTAFGEIAGNSVSSRVWVLGAVCRVTKQLSLSTQLRSYSQLYTDPLAYAFGEQNGTANGETGRYVGMDFRLSEAIKISAYSDEFSLPSGNSFARDGKEYVVRFEGALTNRVSTFVQFKEKTKWDDYAVADQWQNVRTIIQERTQRNLRVSFSFNVGKWMEIAQRVELAQVFYSVSRNQESGILAFTEASSSPAHLPWRATMRMIFFDTHSYDSRVYEYENEVRGGYSSPALYGRGLRWYVVGGWRFSGRTELSFKYSETIKPGRTILGTDNSEITGPLDNAATIQLDIVF